MQLVLITREDGTRIFLGDIANVNDRFNEQPVLRRLNGNPSIALEIDSMAAQDILAITEQLREYIAGKQTDLPHGVALTAWSDRSVTLNSRINLMLKSAAQGAVLVFISLALFLDISLALWVIH